jgi:hypothetical protein
MKNNFKNIAHMEFVAVIASLFVTFLIHTSCSPVAEAKLDTAKIEQLTGIKGELSEKEGVFKVTAPRSDLKITVAGVKMTPPMGLASYAAFTKAGGKTMVMGDTTLLEDQVNPVMSTALDNGLEVTALHNHFLWDSPKVMFMHIGGMGDEEKLAAAVGKVFAKIKHYWDERPISEWCLQNHYRPDDKDGRTRNGKCHGH